MGARVVNASNYKIIKNGHSVLTLAYISLGIYGFTLYFREEFTKLAEISPDHAKMVESCQSMVWLRMIDIIVFFSAICILCFLFGIAFLCRRESIQQYRQRLQEQESRLPSVMNVLSDMSRKYDPNKDIEVEECAICMDLFSVNDERPIAELQCSNLHIFHVECIKEWVQKNDVCPLCRTPILQS